MGSDIGSFTGFYRHNVCTCIRVLGTDSGFGENVSLREAKRIGTYVSISRTYLDTRKGI